MRDLESRDIETDSDIISSKNKSDRQQEREEKVSY